MQDYLRELAKNISTGSFTEHTHRSALKTLFETVWPETTVINEPGRIECGAPDYILLKGNIPWGYIETKDLGIDLDRVEKTEQIQRYLSSLTNFILTNYLEFRWYVNGKLREPISSVGRLDGKSKLSGDSTAFETLRSILDNFHSQRTKTVSSTQELAERMVTSHVYSRSLLLKHIITNLLVGNFMLNLILFGKL